MHKDQLDLNRVKRIIRSVLEEDIGSGDVTTNTIIPDYATIKACILAKEKAVFCGTDILEIVFSMLDETIRFKPQVADGETVEAGREICLLEGRARAILTAERVALNFISHLSGISTLTKKYVDRVEGKIKIYDTRKTTPLLRYLEKYAVRLGGGYNHRTGLWDQVMIKDNHKAILKSKKISLKAADQKLKQFVSKRVLIEIEVDTYEEFVEALELEPHIILLDNMDRTQVKECVDKIKGNKKTENIEIEVSGGIGMENIDQYLGLGVDRISIGALTHSVKSIDFGLEIMV